ncbi:hypothetical protein M9H77_25563 [Catharanthus roseus]|uniref:Uncharacterized protein n=1 Tax=Catharanthus roseus TaxID=4058 RepID=A0ACC0A7A3_CATRO|nr:hypothetical protein M9H77_25563 [Catharanthus roseus]
MDKLKFLGLLFSVSIYKTRKSSAALSFDNPSDGNTVSLSSYRGLYQFLVFSVSIYKSRKSSVTLSYGGSNPSYYNIGPSSPHRRLYQFLFVPPVSFPPSKSPTESPPESPQLPARGHRSSLFDGESSRIMNVFSSLLTPVGAYPSGLITSGVHEIWKFPGYASTPITNLESLLISKLKDEENVGFGVLLDRPTGRKSAMKKT